MSWSALIKIVLAILGELGHKLIDELLKRAAEAAGDPPAATTVAVRKLFETAREQTPWLRFRRRSFLRVAEAMVLKRAPQISQALAGLSATVDPLTPDEQRQLVGVIDL